MQNNAFCYRQVERKDLKWCLCAHAVSLERFTRKRLSYVAWEKVWGTGSPSALFQCEPPKQIKPTQSITESLQFFQKEKLTPISRLEPSKGILS